MEPSTGLTGDRIASQIRKVMGEKYSLFIGRITYAWISRNTYFGEVVEV